MKARLAGFALLMTTSLGCFASDYQTNENSFASHEDSGHHSFFNGHHRHHHHHHGGSGRPDHLPDGNGGGGGPAPIPEPETYAMLLAGLGIMGAMARRHRQRG